MTEQTDRNLQRDIDRVVSGDAAKEELRQLVALLDSHPDGWKRCATAYMEAQSWQRTFSEMMPQADAIPTKPPLTVPGHHAPAARRRFVSTVAAIAIAFIAGIGATVSWQNVSASPEPTDRIAVETDSMPSPETPDPLPVKKETRPRVVGIVNITSGDEMEAAFPLVTAPDKEFVSIELTPEGLNDYTRQLWERKGYRIEQHRKVVDVLLADGHRFQFPIDWVQRRYVGERIY